MKRDQDEGHRLHETPLTGCFMHQKPSILAH